ncbi:MAG TPA: NADH-quinone oxidoreductase subunit C [Rubricoccaceae bacterium]|jgi:NADH-quinone oxidoreductase subunit C
MSSSITERIAGKDVLGEADLAQTIDPGQEKQTLKFFFTPREALAGEMERLRNENPHAKATTFLPDLAAALRDRFPDAIGETTLYAGETTIYISLDGLVDVCRYLYDEVGFTYLSDMVSIDRFTETDRFEVAYNLIALKERRRLRLKVRVDEDDPLVPSVTGVWPNAAWHEREAWDMMGIRFSGLTDHRRIYMPEDFEYHPLRKEFPTLGIPGSLPLPPNESDGSLTRDQFPAAHGDLPKD